MRYEHAEYRLNKGGYGKRGYSFLRLLLPCRACLIVLGGG